VNLIIASTYFGPLKIYIVILRCSPTSGTHHSSPLWPYGSLFCPCWYCLRFLRPKKLIIDSALPNTKAHLALISNFLYKYNTILLMMHKKSNNNRKISVQFFYILYEYNIIKKYSVYFFDYYKYM